MLGVVGNDVASVCTGLRFHEGDGGKNIAQKGVLDLWNFSAINPISVTMFYVGKLSWSWILKKNIQV